MGRAIFWEESTDPDFPELGSYYGKPCVIARDFEGRSSFVWIEFEDGYSCVAYRTDVEILPDREAA